MAGHMKLEVWFDKEEKAWAARYSAPGYMDCTDNVYGQTPEDAAQICFDAYGVYSHEDGVMTPDEEELEDVLEQIRNARMEGKV